MMFYPNDVKILFGSLLEHKPPRLVCSIPVPRARARARVMANGVFISPMLCFINPYDHILKGHGYILKVASSKFIFLPQV
jgi:hypothetical protein